MNTSSDTDYYSSPRRDSTAHRSASDYPGRGRPADQPGEPVEYPKRAKPAAEPPAPRRHIARDADNDDPPMRPARVPSTGALPPRRGQPIQQDEAVAGTEYPHRGKPLPAPVASPRRSVQTIDAGAPPSPHRSTPASAPGPRPAQASAPAAPAKQAELAGGGPAGSTYTTGSDAAELEIILKMFETKVSTLEITARDLHTLASLISMLGQHVSRLAKEKEEIAKRASGHANAEEPPELAD